KTISAIGCYGMTAITALTAQNTTGVLGIYPVPADFLHAKLQSVLSDIIPDAVKIGMIPDEASANVIAETIEKHSLKNIVLDPVMIATSGDHLSSPATLDVMRSHIFPYATFITPNLPEAETILNRKIQSTAEMQFAASEIITEYGCKGVILKGGHSERTDSDKMTDIIAIQDTGNTTVYPYTHSYVDTSNTHGTGCSLSSALAAHLALGFPAVESAARSILWLNKAIYAGKDHILGHGHGPVNHMFLNTNHTLQ
ncbi:MAG: bifunctional hydroxymethylpyrimidine kinase/phosphomethylpyrimidine kinase, partial [Muribaculaceae bacterium]|nr:bifunctional hydroxymethylpyrimidine kinase/phosphomethylpyrimidine kinase [Muribaculaceae bacterium]